MRTMLVLLLFFGISCLLLTSDGRLLKSALRFAEAQVQQAKEYLGRINPSYRNNQKRRTKQYGSAVAAVSSMGRSNKNEPLLMRLTSKWSRSIKKSTKFVAIFAIAIIAGHGMSSQLAAAVPPGGPSQPLTSLKTVPIPGPSPSELAVYVKDKKTAIMLGKSLFWDMQVGSDGIQACASCHFNAGADNRIKNQISPGLLRVTPGADTTFQTGRPNYTLQSGDFPFHKLADPNDRNSEVISDSNDVSSSQGVFNTQFVDIIRGSANDKVIFTPDAVFNVASTETRRVEPRNTPTMINAVFNFRNFWDGRAQNEFNGVNPFGKRDPNAKVLKAATATSPLQEVRVSLKDSSLASQAVGPPLSAFEMSADGRTFEEIGQKFGSIDTRSRSAAKGRRLPRETAQKLFSLTPLGKQLVARDDSVLGSVTKFPQPGINQNYEALVKTAFQPVWWQSNYIVVINPTDGSRSFAPRPNRALATNEYTLAEYNFSLFFGLAIQLYESTLVSNNAPIDQYLEGNYNALTPTQKLGLDIFENQGKCINCHGGAEFTNASVKNVRNEKIERMIMGDNNTAVYDNGFYNIGVTPTFEDLGVGAQDPFGKPLSMSRLGQQPGQTPEEVHCAPDIPNPEPCLPLNPNERVAVDGAFKTPGLRNVELTAPYFHNGGQLNLAQVVAFYNRGGDRRGPNGDDTTGFPPNNSNLDPDIQNLGLNLPQQEALVEFMRALTDDRVKYRRAPFDHPQLFITNGHPGNQNAVTADADGKATDTLIEIPAVGRNGGPPLPTFLGT